MMIFVILMVILLLLLVLLAYYVAYLLIMPETIWGLVTVGAIGTGLLLLFFLIVRLIFITIEWFLDQKRMKREIKIEAERKRGREA
ncbi:hypothetical protein [Ignatzschineria cameli]|uniref:hypothetical protein n=1 Tax=Ignatzschineria cameli TaxID=2182793 RepID=UPI000D610241|nr:hypothetical protein [Ignatzschineria cameli]PWD87543.1 hypothetical protein DC080_01630 [Ignatzschineria cameli]